jgi:hypothetical protein
MWLIWVNKDTFIVAQSSNPYYGKIVAINFTKIEKTSLNQHILYVE